MALKIVDGQVGAGKSYFCVDVIVRLLLENQRVIFTNVAVKPTALACYVALVRERRRFGARRGRGTTEETKARIRELKSRIHVLTNEKIATFWKLPLRHSMVIMDELHRVFSSRDWKKFPKEGLDAISMHRHGDIEMMVLSQHSGNIESTFRRHAHELVRLRNSRATSIFPQRLLRWIKWPLQFFMVKRYDMEGGKVVGDPVGEYALWPWFGRRLLFRCYDSHCIDAELPCLGDAVDGAADLRKVKEYERSWLWHLGTQLSQNLMAVSMLIGMVIIAVGGYKFLWGSWSPRKKRILRERVARVEDEKAVTLAKTTSNEHLGEKASQEVAIPRIGAVGMTSDSVILDNGSIWRINEWILKDGQECGLVFVSLPERCFWWGVRGRNGKVSGAWKSILGRGPCLPVTSKQKR